MSRFRFSLATAEDDAALRRRMAADWLEGSLAVSFRREPSYFAAGDVQGDRVEVVKCTDLATGEIIGMGSRAVRTVFLNGIPHSAGYLADLRSHPGYRNGTLLARGYRFLRQLHDAAPVPLYYTMILEGNHAALSSLTGARAGLPHYRPLGRILTPAIHLDLPRPAIALRGVAVERGSAARAPEILRFVQTAYAARQFAPLYRTLDLRGLDASDFYLAVRDGRIAGTLAAWDQRAFRQTHIERYSGGWRLARPLYNLAARLTPLKALPRPGSIVPYFYLAFAAAEDADPRIFRLLLRALYRDRRAGPWHYCIAGLDERDPLAAVLAEYRSIPAAGRLFAVHYDEDEAAFRRLDGRTPFVEIATL
ncbi:MAG: hypothetical protein ACRD96_14570 [Bryobacteraceae bacterium]